MFLKALDTGKLFLYCTDCEAAWGSLPTGDSDAEMSVPDMFAPHGIVLPTHVEIEAFGWGHHIAEEATVADRGTSLWRLWAITAIVSEEYSVALGILNEVISTWHQPPDTAQVLLGDAIRLRSASSAAIDGGCVTSTVLALAQVIHADRAFSILPILGDALEDAGCTDERVLAHCRNQLPHYGGCWVINLLLGKD